MKPLIFYQNGALDQVKDLGGKFIPSGNLGDFVGMLVWGFIFLAAVIVVVIMVKNFVKYRYAGEVYKRRQNDPLTGEPQSVVISGKAGYFKKNGIPTFRIKYGFLPWQQVEIMKLPDPKYMVGNKAIFYQYNIGEIVQAKAVMDWNKGDVIIEPVDSTTKAAAKLEVSQYSAIFSTKKLLQENAGIVIMGFLFIAGIVAMYFVSKTCGG